MKNNLYILLCLLLSLSTQALYAQTPHYGPLSPERVQVNPILKPFYHGVASGDPLTDRIILWTRVTPDSTVTGSITVNWQMATDTTFAAIVNSGTTTTDNAKDYTVKVDAAGLLPNTYYYYRFEAMGAQSIIGRTKTLPIGNIDTLRFAVVSCSNFANGFFHAYDAIARRNDVDAVLHLGDYIYEGGGAAFIEERNHAPAYEILNLMDYRLRHSQYKLDPNLRCAHQQYPFICVWDDHETANNSWMNGAENHDPATEGNWNDRKWAGTKAYAEWMPIRMPDVNDSLRIFRTVPYGNMADLIMLDTRLYGREEQSNTTNTDTARTMLGKEQLSWFKQQLSSSQAQWKIAGQQVMMAPLRIANIPLNQDQWDGYPAERQKIYDYLQANNIQNFTVLTGDIHSSWANDLPLAGYNGNTGANSAGVEFVTTSITSSNVPFSVSQTLIEALNPHIKYSELTEHGYIILDINGSRMQGDYYFVSDISIPTYTENFASGWYVNAGESFLREATTPSISSSIVGQIQPACVSEPLVSIDAQSIDNLSILAAYPNPFTEDILLEYHLQSTAEIQLSVVDMMGKTLKTIEIGKRNMGLFVIGVELHDLPAGNYFIQLRSDGKLCSKLMVKR